jgi:putative FmdB family regulatory protein
LPIYEYRCEACGHTFELFQKFADKPIESCEVCGGRVNKVLFPVAVHFKGSGFYTTDYGRGSKTARAADSGAKADSSAKTADESVTKTTGNGDGAKKGATGKGGEAAKPAKTDKAG